MRKQPEEQLQAKHAVEWEVFQYLDREQQGSVSLEQFDSRMAELGCDTKEPHTAPHTATHALLQHSIHHLSHWLNPPSRRRRPPFPDAGTRPRRPRCGRCYQRRARLRRRSRSSWRRGGYCTTAPSTRA